MPPNRSHEACQGILPQNGGPFQKAVHAGADASVSQRGLVTADGQSVTAPDL